MRLSVFLIALSALAQEAPEIRGTVIEYGPNTAVAGATVTLYESVPGETDPGKLIASTVTDPQGRFSFKPGQYGNYTVNASMIGYTPPPMGGLMYSNTRVSAMNDGPHVSILVLMRPASLSGRFVDVNDRPIANLFVQVTRTGSVPKEVSTDADGVFTLSDAIPGPYVVRALPTAAMPKVVESFTPEDAAAADEDYDSSYWPGGASNQGSALPITVSPGASADIGKITLRRVPYQRLLIPVSSNCAPGERWILRLFEQPSPAFLATLPLSCTSAFLLRNIRPGSYLFTLSSGTNVQEPSGWALAHVVVPARNLTLPLTMSPAVDIAGRIAGSAKPAEFTISLNARDNLARGKPASPDEQGRFTIPRVNWPRQGVTIQSLNPESYVKEIRYNNQVIADGMIDLVPGGALAITAETGAGTITGKIPGVRAREGAVVLFKWPRGDRPNTLEPAPPFQYLVLAEPDGTFSLSSLAPGEYRVAALPVATMVNMSDAAVFDRVMRQARTVKADAGATTTLELKLIDLTN